MRYGNTNPTEKDIAPVFLTLLIIHQIMKTSSFPGNSRMADYKRHEMRVRSTESGWTFIEIIIVITIILVLTSTVGIVGVRYVDRARVSAAVNEMAALSVALDGYYLDCGRYPTEEQGLAALWTVPTIPPIPDGWAGPYLSKEDFEDPWGTPYRYVVPGPHGLPFGVTSQGADRLEGGEGKDADIASWES